jgi:hypothetical protein
VVAGGKGLCQRERDAFSINNCPSRSTVDHLTIQTVAPHDSGRAEDRLSAAHTALGSSSQSISQPFRAGLTFGGRPSGPCICGDLCPVISPSTCPRQVSCSHAPSTASRDRRDRRGRRDDKTERVAERRGPLPRTRAFVGAVSACEVVHAGGAPNRMPLSTETFRERSTKENQVASVGRVLSEWLEMLPQGLKPDVFSILYGPTKVVP